MNGRIKKATRFDGFDYIFEKDEFDGIMSAFDEVIKANETAYPDYVSTKIKTQEKILKYSYFDPDEKEVHIRLDMIELREVLEALTMYAAYMACYTEMESEKKFDSIIKKSNIKIWNSKTAGN